MVWIFLPHPSLPRQVGSFKPVTGAVWPGPQALEPGRPRSFHSYCIVPSLPFILCKDPRQEQSTSPCLQGSTTGDCLPLLARIHGTARAVSPHTGPEDWVMVLPVFALSDMDFSHCLSTAWLVVMPKHTAWIVEILHRPDAGNSGPSPAL